MSFGSIDADRGPGHRDRPRQGPPARREDRPRDEEDLLPARRRVRADARLPDRRGRHRPREGRPERGQGRGRERRRDLATSSTRFASLNYWVDVKTGFDYLVQLQIPPVRHDNPEEVETLPITQVNPPGQPDDPRRGEGPPGQSRCPARSTATCRSATSPWSRTSRGKTWAGPPPGRRRRSRRPAHPLEGSGSIPMGQLPPMNEMFESLGHGLWGCRVRDPRCS